MRETNSSVGQFSERNIPKNSLVPAGTPNDGFPESWHPVEGPEPVGVGLRGYPSIGPNPRSRFFGNSIALPLLLDTELTHSPGGYAAYRVMPPVASGSPALNSAIKSFTGK
jgi:hypothetical protein